MRLAVCTKWEGEDETSWRVRMSSGMVKEARRDHGIAIAFCACIAFRLIVAVSSLSSSSAVSPERKKMPASPPAPCGAASGP